MISEKKAAANRKNAQRSTGPKTMVGKQHVKENALKHGFYSKELRLSDEQKIEFENLRIAIRRHLAPNTPLQELAYEEIVCCSWRCRSAIRLEVRGLKPYTESQDGEPSSGAESGRPVMNRWYASSRQHLNQGVRFLEELKNTIKYHGTVPDDWREGIMKGFGADFLEALTKWTPIAYDNLLLANALQAKSKRFGMPLPKDLLVPNVVADPQQGREMMFKLLDQQIQHLRDLSGTLDGGIRAVEASPVDFAPRYFTTASRDLHRAVEWFRNLKENNM
jgi:hypothetical protein